MRKGYLLIESMVAITVIVVGLLGIFALLSKSLSLNRVINDRYVASYLAAEGVEIVKNLIDNNVLSGDSWNKNLRDGNYQFDYSASILPSDCGDICNKVFYWDASQKAYSLAPAGQRTNFIRKVSLKLIADKSGLVQSIQVNSVVDWVTRGGANFSINLEDHFYNYR